MSTSRFGPNAPPAANGNAHGNGAQGAEAPMLLDFAGMRESIRAGKATPAWLASWLEKSYASPGAFRTALYMFAAARREDAIKSRPHVGFDFYHDCVLAHVGQRRRALVAREGRDLSSITFESLHARVSSLAAAWTREGVVPGTKVCVMLGRSSTFVVAVLTALRLGAVLSVLPPRGPTYVKTRLMVLAPDKVATDQAGARLAGVLLPAANVLPLAAQAGDVATAVSHTYLPGEQVAALVSPLVSRGAEAYGVTADVLHFSLLRDALLVHALDNKDTVAAPGFSEAQHQPSLVLSTLLAGASFADIEDKDLDLDPKLTSKLGVTVLGVTPALRERIFALKAAGKATKLAERAFFRSLTDPLDLGRWDDLARLLSKDGLLGYSVLLTAAAGGVQLFSGPRPPPMALGVFPSPGQSWQLSEIAGGTVQTLGTSGVYHAMFDEEVQPAVPNVVLAKSGDDYLYVGPLEPGPAGCSYPAEEVAAVVTRHPEVRAAAAIVTAGAFINDAKVVLLAFTDDPAVADSPPTEEFRMLIDREMGPGFLPDRIEVFALRPRYIEDGSVDVGWCRSQYVSGGLRRRSRSDLFLALARIGWIFGEAPKKATNGSSDA
ncbi:MAG TPA: AMP-binding protein [Labilithrix sp.]|nr:AMP-binding protein [Labilithrix sp.]